MRKIFVLSVAFLAGAAMAQTQDSYEYDRFGPQDYEAIEEYRQSEEYQAQHMEANRVPAAAEGMRHMFEFNIDSAMSAALSFEKTKTRGTKSDNETNALIDLNYAYGVAPLLQIGTRFNYFSGVTSTAKEENWSLSVGGIVNHKEDFSSSAYVSLYVGAGVGQRYGNNRTRDDLRHGTLAIGKRFPLDGIGLKNVTYTPEIAAQMINSTTKQAIEYTQSLQFRILQFSVFF